MNEDLKSKFINIDIRFYEVFLCTKVSAGELVALRSLLKTFFLLSVRIRIIDHGSGIPLNNNHVDLL